MVNQSKHPSIESLLGKAKLKDIELCQSKAGGSVGHTCPGGLEKVGLMWARVSGKVSEGNVSLCGLISQLTSPEISWDPVWCRPASESGDPSPRQQLHAGE